MKHLTIDITNAGYLTSDDPLGQRGIIRVRLDDVDWSINFTDRIRLGEKGGVKLLGNMVKDILMQAYLTEAARAPNAR